MIGDIADDKFLERVITADVCRYFNIIMLQMLIEQLRPNILLKPLLLRLSRKHRDGGSNLSHPVLMF